MDLKGRLILGILIGRNPVEAENTWLHVVRRRYTELIPQLMAAEALTRPLVLCIDDAEIALRVRKLLLASAGYSVLTAASGEEGLEVFKQNPVELVIADHFLSDRTGVEIASEMKQLKPQVPILIVSAAAEAPPDLQFTDGFLSKGDGPDKLLDAISELLRAHPSSV